MSCISFVGDVLHIRGAKASNTTDSLESCARFAIHISDCREWRSLVDYVGVAQW